MIVAPLQFHDADVRMIVRDDEPWWILNDVCRVLEIANPRDAARRLRDWQRDDVGITDTIGRRQTTTIVNEAAIYKLVLSSRKPIAEEFERWLTCDVLPAIRKFGCYPAPSSNSHLSLPNDQWDGIEKTVGERFREERERWEANEGLPLAGTVPFMTKSVVRAIEDNLGGVRKGQRIEYLLYAGIDVLYVLTGRRTLTSAERMLRDTFRVISSNEQAALLARAKASRTNSLVADGALQITEN